MTEQTASTSPEVLHLDVEHGDRQVVITPADQDRFVSTVGEVVKKLQADALREQGMRQFREATGALFLRLIGWMREHRNDISSAWVTQRDGRLLFLVVSNQMPYNQALSDALIELDVSIANDAETKILSVGVLMIPPMGEAPEACFLSSQMALPIKSD